jgi:hypothetical protein
MNEIEKQADNLIKEKEGFYYDITEYYLFWFVLVILSIFASLVLEIKRNLVLIIISFDVLLLFVPFIQNFYLFKKLKKDEEYLLAKKVMRKYEERLNKEKIKEVLRNEQEKSSIIKDMKEYIKDNN